MSRGIHPRVRSRALLALAVPILLLGCGGGGGSGGGTFVPAPAAAAPAPGPATTPPPMPAPPPAAPSASVTGFATGTFPPSTLFEARCAAPRTGIDPRTGRPWPDAQGTTVDENAWLRSWSNELYLWFDEIDDVDPASLPTPAYFDRMRTFETTATGAPKDRFHFTRDTESYLAFSRSGIVAGYGAEFAVLSASPPREVRIAFLAPGGPADAAGLARGTEIVTIDGVDVRTDAADEDLAVINGALFDAAPGASHVFGVLDPGAAAVREVTLTAAELSAPPVQAATVLDTPTGPVGYLAFHDHIATAEDALADAFEDFAAAAVTDVVVDLRYNGGGLLAIAAQLGTMVAGPAATGGRVFEELEFNEKHTQFDPVTGRRLAPDLFPTTTLGFSRTAGQTLPSVNLERVFVLTGGGTCSASESFMNSLRGIGVEVVQIGENTCGKPYGFYPTDNCGTTYFSIQFRGVNARGFGDYAEGFAPGLALGPAGVVPGCVVADDFTRALGDPAEARLAAALAWRETGACPATVSASARRAGATGRSRLPGSAIGPPAWRTGAWRTP